MAGQMLTTTPTVSGALEPQFFQQLLKGLGLADADLPGPRESREHWPQLRKLLTGRFKTKTRSEWESIFDGTDACCTPVLSQSELESSGYLQRPAVFLDESPARAIAVGSPRSPRDGQGKGVAGAGWTGQVLYPGPRGEQLLHEWIGHEVGKEISQINGSFQLAQTAKL